MLLILIFDHYHYLTLHPRPPAGASLVSARARPLVAAYELE